MLQTDISVQFPQTIFDSGFSDDKNSTIYSRKNKTPPN